MKKLPYRAQTSTGDTFDIEFPLHSETQSAVRVAQLVSALLETIDKDIAVAGETSNGDVLQAMAMAMAVRTRMIHASSDTSAGLSTHLLTVALKAAADAVHRVPTSGRA